MHSRSNICSRPVYLIMILLAIHLIACAEEKSQIQKLSEEEATEIGAIGSQAAGLLLKTLQSELLTAIREKGVAGAIDVCRVRALKLTDSLASVSGRVEKIKRTSTKIRNPLNHPDPYEKEALDHFTEQSPHNFSENYIQKWSDEKGTYYRFYKPLQVKPLCLTCHGKKETIGSELGVKLKAAYPEDQATGYQEGDFRGVVSITIR